MKTNSVVELRSCGFSREKTNWGKIEMVNTTSKSTYINAKNMPIKRAQTTMTGCVDPLELNHSLINTI
jgi:hypothetical protein